MPGDQASFGPVAVVIAAAGSGIRAGGDVPKQWRVLQDRPLVAHTFRVFDALPFVSEIIVVVDAESLADPQRTDFLASGSGKRCTVVAGSGTRQESVWQGLRAIETDPHVVLIHDAARPFADPGCIEQCALEASRYGGSVLATPVHETIKRVDADGCVVASLDRSVLWAAQTPQGFRYGELLEAYRTVHDRLDGFTDDAGIYESWGGTVRVVESTSANFKVTTAKDFARAEACLRTSGDTA